MNTTSDLPPLLFDLKYSNLIASAVRMHALARANPEAAIATLVGWGWAVVTHTERRIYLIKEGCWMWLENGHVYAGSITL